MKGIMRIGLLCGVAAILSTLLFPTWAASEGRLKTLKELISPLRGREVSKLDQLPFQRLIVIYEAWLGSPDQAGKACDAALAKFPEVESFQILRSSLIALASEADATQVIPGLGPSKTYLKGVLERDGAMASSDLIAEANKDTTDLHIWFELGLAYQKIGKQNLANEAFLRSSELSNETGVR